MVWETWYLGGSNVTPIVSETAGTESPHLGHQSCCWSVPVVPHNLANSGTLGRPAECPALYASRLISASNSPAATNLQASGWGHSLSIIPLEPHATAMQPTSCIETHKAGRNNLTAWGYNQHGQVNALCQTWVRVMYLWRKCFTNGWSSMRLLFLKRVGYFT